MKGIKKLFLICGTLLILVMSYGIAWSVKEIVPGFPDGIYLTCYAAVVFVTGAICYQFIDSYWPS